MNILIRTAGGVPIYEQIFTQLRDEICSGALPPGEALPSIRSLARDLRVSVITTKRAYEELERAGYVVTVAGKGSFVAERDLELEQEAPRDRVAPERRRSAWEKMRCHRVGACGNAPLTVGGVNTDEQKCH